MDNGIRLAEERDIHVLCEIWKVCFCDNEDYVRFFYRENRGQVTSTVYTVDDKPVSMLHWFDSTFVNGTERKKAKYLYAGGSLPEHRKNGYYGALIKYVEDYAKENGVVLFGKPATQSLIPYYSTFDFTPDARFRLVTVVPEGKTPLEFYPVTPHEYNRLRDNAFRSRPYAAWQDRYVEYAVAENAFFGGKTIAIEYEGATHFLMGAPKGDTLLITETDLSLPQLKKLAGALCDTFNTVQLKAYLPEDSCNEGEVIVSSVVNNAPLWNTYVNLLLI
ncbi:MAG: GNAT family N-acetyltransferase [Clostridia bacterium]|nr:GNAT family N-acetyltransferase [Clostridia bacterium]